LRLFSFGGYGLALAVLALMVFGAIECHPKVCKAGTKEIKKNAAVFFPCGLDSEITVPF